MKRVATFLTVILCLQSSFAQESARVSGSIVSDQGDHVAFATLMLFSAKDTSLVKADVSDLDGSFVFQSLPRGSYFMSISYVGFQDLTTSVFKVMEGASVELPSVKLVERAEELSEIVVKAARPIIEVEPDKTVFNIDGSINSSGSDALELLRKAPGVVVDNNDRIMLLGKNGVQIYIDGKKSPLSADDLADFLKSLQSDEIDAFEIVTNPSAKYDAEGNAGIINIRIKKDKSLGSNGTVTTTLRQGITLKNSNALSFNNRTKDLNVFGRYGNNFGQWRNFNDIHRLQLGQGFDAHSDMVSDDRGHSFRLGADFFLSEHSTLGVLLNGSLKNGDWFSEARTRIYDLSTNLTTGFLIAENTMRQDRDNFNANINFVHKGEDKSRLNIDVDFGLFLNRGDSYQPNKYMDVNESELLDQRIFRSVTPTDINIYTLKLDYERPLWGGQFATGAKSSYVSTDNTFDFFDVVDGQDLVNEERSNNFIYKENVNALYATYQYQGDKWNVMLGMRAEHTHSMGQLTSVQSSNDELVKRDYLDFFPSGGITFTANQNNSWRFNYSRRIDRPSYQDLNPFELKLDELTFQKGNAFLTPQYTHSVSLTHTFKQRLNTTLSYSITNDLITEITDTFSADASFITYVNLAKQKNISLAVSYPFSVSKWWSVYTNATAYRVQNKADFGGSKIIDLAANVFTFYGQNTFLLPKGLKLEVSGFYNSPGIWGGNFKTESLWGIDLGIQSKLFKDRANVKVALTDVFKTQRWTGTNDFGALQVIAGGGYESRQLRATLSYNFGNDQVKHVRNRNTGLEDEKKRIK